MSITEQYLIDGFETDNKEVLTLHINDSLLWNEEIEGTHLYHLENKIKYYIEYIRGRKFDSLFKNNQYSSFIIKYIYEYELPQPALDLLEKYKDEFKENKITFKLSYSKQNFSG
ncbi:DUF6572 domain-containing protein [Miniphocaeibacter halophilus]|uniref:Uncharacterized protein n=1 Tax=Miniphocaeibacter halophilus TaxID=2931922 RepID=A0AC61MRF2_9FIRM|nr:DUF6572 domain-containing protein [Miniphocaeibacter halophilus]QQK07006.1 hypothetical protein JFY71_06565 [Miniphocaeibacter halophilus]